MILFDLRCKNEHVFEAWFKNSEAFDQQLRAGEVSCPVCGNANIEKALMAPRLPKKSNTGESGVKNGPPEGVQQYMSALKEIRRHVEENCDYVGENFAEEARKIHYGETEERGIYGEATNEEARALDEEGVDVKRIPWAPREDA